KANLKKALSNSSYATNPNTWTCSYATYLNNRFLLCKHLVQSVRPQKPSFFNEVKRYRSPPFWRHEDLVPLVQGLNPINEFDKEDEPIEGNKFSELEEQAENDDEQSNDETDDELIEVLQEYEEDEANVSDIVAERWDEVNSRVTEKLQ
ncbi:4635_t:CDS:1, partial [Ambispora leptoticha]